MRKTVLVLLLALVLVLTLPAAASAQTNMPVGGCPSGFDLMEVMVHDSMEHTHIGLKVDLNQDGYLCMSKATSSLHVHVDNTVVLP
jgi:hypothetical protein